MSDKDFPIVEQIKLAGSKREIARLLLRMSDRLLLTHGEVIAAECRRARFNEAVSFIAMRLAVLDAVRDRQGRLPDAAAAPLENWRMAFAAFAWSAPS